MSVPMAKVRYPLVQAFMSRNGAAGSNDAFVVNGVAEKYNDKLYVTKRPGLTLTQFNSYAGIPQGAFFYAGIVYEIFGDVLYLQSTVNNGTTGSAFTKATTPAWINRLSSATCVFNNRMWIIGGNGNYSNSIWSSQDGQTWAVNAGGQPWGQRKGGQVVVFNNKMWFMGGVNEATSTAYNDVWSTPDGQNWTQVTASAPWSARYWFNAIANNGGIYVSMGQTTGSVLNNEVWFTSDGVNWVLLTSATTTPATPWSARIGAGMTWFNGNIYVYGGNNGSTNLNDCYSSPDGINWTLVNASVAWSARSFFATCVYNNKLWILGGVSPGYTADVYSSSDGNTWSLVTTTPGFSARENAQALVFPAPFSASTNRFFDIWLLGGYNGSPINDVWYGNINQATSASYNLNPTVANQYCQFATFNNGQTLIIKNQNNMWILNAGTLTPITDPNYPPQTVPGLVVLNQFAYVMTPQKEIHACGINDATLWPALQYTTASYEDDPGVFLGKFLNYIVAYGQKTTQYFYDNANPPPGIAISPYINANQRVGCANAISVCNAANAMFFIGQTSSGNIGVYTIKSVVPEKISSNWVDLVLQNGVTSLNTAFVLSEGGHSFYCLQFAAAGYSMVYDIDMGWWSVWKDATGTQPFPVYYCISDTSTYGSSPYCVASNGSIYTASFSVYTDAGSAFPMIVQTDKIDDGKMVKKFWGKLDLVADQSPSFPGAVMVDVRTSDNDYESFTLWGSVDEASTRPSLNRGGSSRRRAFRISSNNSFYERWEAIELTYSEGES